MRPLSERNAAVLLVGVVMPAEIRSVQKHLRAIIDAGDLKLVTCDVSVVTVDAGAVDGLARLQLTARERGCRLELRHASRGLEELIAFCGLEDVLPSELVLERGGQPEQREQPRRVEERVEPGDAPV